MCNGDCARFYLKQPSLNCLFHFSKRYISISTLFLSLYLCLSVSLFLSLSFSFSLSLFFSLSFSLSLSLSVCLSISLSLSLYFSIYFFLFLSLYFPLFCIYGHFLSLLIYYWYIFVNKIKEKLCKSLYFKKKIKICPITIYFT